MTIAVPNFYPRSPCGERQDVVTKLSPVLGFLSTLSLRRATMVNTLQKLEDGISIHALLAESDRYVTFSSGFHVISIHALLAESDISRYTARPLSSYFYPRSPCGERPAQPHYQSKNNIFLSTLSLRRATDCGQYYIRARGISIHALLAESDL